MMQTPHSTYLLLILFACLVGCGNNETSTTNDFEGDVPGECDNGADDDRDGRFDCDDDNCAGAPVCRPRQAGDGSAVNDNGDGGESGTNGDDNTNTDNIDFGGDSNSDGGSAPQGDSPDSANNEPASGEAGIESDGVDGNAGTAAEAGSENEACLTDEEFLATHVWSQVFAERCVGCHQEGGLAQYSDMVLKPESSPSWQRHNLEQITQVVAQTQDEVPIILLKPTGRHPDGHAGGQLLLENSDEYRRLDELVGRILDEVDECGNTTSEPAEALDDCERLMPGRRLLRRLSHVEYQNTIRDLLGIEINARGAFVADTVDHGFENHPEKLDVTGLLADQYRQMAESLSERVDLEPLLPCTVAMGDIHCAHAFIADFGKRAYRRPLTADEIAAYRDLYRLVVEQACFEDGIRWIIIGILQSPHFLYRSELGRRNGDTFTLTPYEIASGLSYLLWQTMPDDALFDAAADGSLLQPTVVAAHVRRLLDDPKSIEMANDFMGHWLELDGLMQVVRDSEIYAALYFELREAMSQETKLFVEDLWRQNAPLSDLFQSDTSWLNEALATYYNVDLGEAQEHGNGFYQVDVSATRPAGILTQGAFLTTHALPTSSSPIHRGVVIRERLLCNELQPPPEGLVIVPPPFDPTLTTRERFAAHSADIQCEGCHRLIDPIGLGFENYDGIGRYRDTEGGAPVDASGSVTRLTGEDTAFSGIDQLAEILATDTEVTACYSRQWLRFGFGETEGLNADCYVNALHQDLQSEAGRLHTVVNALTRTPHFFSRQGGESEQDAPGVNLTPTAPGTSPTGTDPTTPPPDLVNPTCGTPPPMGNGAGVNDPRLSVDVRDDRWASGYCQYVTISNMSTESIDGWSVEIEVEGTLNSAWNVEYTGDTGAVVFSNLSWNSVLPSDGQVEFGYCATL